MAVVGWRDKVQLLVVVGMVDACQIEQQMGQTVGHKRTVGSSTYQVYRFRILLLIALLLDTLSKRARAKKVNMLSKSEREGET